LVVATLESQGPFPALGEHQQRRQRIRRGFRNIRSEYYVNVIEGDTPKEKEGGTGRRVRPGTRPGDAEQRGSGALYPGDPRARGRGPWLPGVWKINRGEVNKGERLGR